MRRIGRLLEDCNANGLRHDLLEQFEPLHGQFRGHDGEPGYVAARARQTCDQTAFQRVARRSHDDRDALRCALRGADRSGTADYDDIDLRPQQIADQRGYRVDIIPIMAKLVGDVAPFDITEVAHPAHEFLAEWIVVRGSRPDVPDTRRLAALLRVRCKRPRGCRAAECGQQFPPSHGDCHTPLPCEVRKWNDTTPRACCPNSAAPGAVKPGMDDEPVVPRPCSRRQVNRKWELRARPGWASHSQIGIYGIPACRWKVLPRLDPSCSDYFAPLLGFVDDECSQLNRSHRHRLNH